jgi:hypothetical protein
MYKRTTLRIDTGRMAATERSWSIILAESILEDSWTTHPQVGCREQPESERSGNSNVHGMYWDGDMGETHEHSMNTLVGSSVDVV